MRGEEGDGKVGGEGTAMSNARNCNGCNCFTRGEKRDAGRYHRKFSLPKTLGLSIVVHIIKARHDIRNVRSNRKI